MVEGYLTTTKSNFPSPHQLIHHGRRGTLRLGLADFIRFVAQSPPTNPPASPNVNRLLTDVLAPKKKNNKKKKGAKDKSNGDTKTVAEIKKDDSVGLGDQGDGDDGQESGPSELVRLTPVHNRGERQQRLMSLTEHTK